MDLEVYKNDILGNISQLHGKAPLGLMDMETIIFTCVNKDLPLFNVDRIEVGGKQTLIIELYDTQLRHNSFDQSGFIKAKASLADLNNYEHNAHWYDYLRMDCSIAKKGSKSDFKRFDNTIRECLLSYLRQAESLPELSAEEKKLKKEKACEYMNNLVEKAERPRTVLSSPSARRNQKPV